MLGRPLGKLKVYVHAVALGPCVAVRDAFVVRLIAQQTGDQRAIRAVAAAGRGEGAEQRDIRPARRALAQQPPRDAPQPNRAGRVRAARPDHHRAENIEKIHSCSSPLVVCNVNV